ncbi:hypothetical protein [Tistrella sp.]|uniref:hypothetical protein n=1 Tax=Tistrella sp. TaxID=2024861 RepID=UPI0025F2195D|nr:hypothetical protein [Tistrella sp.]
MAELASGLEHYDRPGDRSIRMGSRRNHLEQSDSPVLRRLLDRLWRVACDCLPADPANPFLRARAGCASALRPTAASRQPPAAGREAGTSAGSAPSPASWC